MGKSSDMARLMMFNDQVSALAEKLAEDLDRDRTHYQGAGLWQRSGSAVRRVQVPWDPAVSAPGSRGGKVQRSVAR